MQRALQTVHADAFDVNFRDYGFFPTARSPRVFWIGIHAGSQLASLAATIDATMAPIGVPMEEHVFSPHLTLARRTLARRAGGSGDPRQNKHDRSNLTFLRLQEKLAAMSQLDFGNMTARQFFLYRSDLSPGGSRYTKLFSFPLT